MSQDDKLPDTLSLQSPINSSEIPNSLPPTWGRLVKRKAFLQSTELRNVSYMFGKNETCDIHINSYNMPLNILKHISKEHFIISRDNTLMPYVKDISKNGTYLNGTLIGRDNSVALRDGDLIAVGMKLNEIYQYKDEGTSSVSEYFDKKYKITRLLGKGAFGEVYLAIAKGTCTRYAAKQIEINPRDELKIENEINILKKLNHPCVIKMVEAIYCPKGYVYILLDFMEGGDLEKKVLRNRKLTESSAKLFVYQIALAVKYLHSCGITHRDLKPENVLLATNNSETLVKVTDFGMSKFVNPSSLLHSLCGTPLYVAPEILNSGSYTPLVDVWSLGCITYFTIWGRTPFQRNDEEYDDDEDCLPYLFNRIKQGKFKIPTQELGENVSDEAVSLILNMLILDPKKRIQVKEILAHEWFQDTKMLTTIKKLL